MKLDWLAYESQARKMAAEGCVLLKNEEVLPVRKGRVAVFGRIQSHYYKSGTGSGGMVNVSKVVGILDGLKACENLKLDEDLIRVYEEWEQDHPYDHGKGWAMTPWSQEEMPITEDFAKEYGKKNDVAIVIIGRTAGEDQDSSVTAGSYLLSEEELQMLRGVRKGFHKMILLFNVAGMIHMGYEEIQQADALLYVYQGGMLGGDAVADVITGKVNPSGRLTDTIAKEITDYPSTANFDKEQKETGEDGDQDIYEEDIYVGYRYFETVAKEKVLYPFGYGLSYTTFEMKGKNFSEKEGEISFDVQVTNTGAASGRQVVEIYLSAPQGKLGKPAMVLVDFHKTKELAPQEEETLHFTVDPYTYASYDDHPENGEYGYYLEEGEYQVWLGESVRNTTMLGTFQQGERRQIQKLSSHLAPLQEFKRMKPVPNEETHAFEMTKEWVPTGEKKERELRDQSLPVSISFTGDQGISLQDVADGTNTLEQWIAQIPDEEFVCLVRGEGMGSPKVTMGTAAAYGGVSDFLQEKGLPAACCSDGPSGLRIDSGTEAFSLPIGTLLASTWDVEGMKKLYHYLGLEMRVRHIDNLLGPGMNIHRNPLNGRNFEYFSEDPLVTGRMGRAMIQGLQEAGVTGTMKHFVANNRERNRYHLESVISERALREIYLKGFEIAVRGGGDSVMTTYGRVNGSYTAGRYELNTCILRGEWGFQGIVMTDWWAFINDQRQLPGQKNDFASMVRAQNDLYMVCPQGDQNSTNDNLLRELQEGTLTRGELQRSGMNIVRQIMKMPAFLKDLEEVEFVNGPDGLTGFDTKNAPYHDMEGGTCVDLSDQDTSQGARIVLAFGRKEHSDYRVTFHYESDGVELAQIPIAIFSQGGPAGAVMFNGTGGAPGRKSITVHVVNQYAIIQLRFNQEGIRLQQMEITPCESLEKPDMYWN